MATQEHTEGKYEGNLFDIRTIELVGGGRYKLDCDNAARLSSPEGRFRRGANSLLFLPSYEILSRCTSPIPTYFRGKEDRCIDFLTKFNFGEGDPRKILLVTFSGDGEDFGGFGWDSESALLSFTERGRTRYLTEVCSVLVSKRPSIGSRPIEVLEDREIQNIGETRHRVGRINPNTIERILSSPRAS